MTQVTKLNYSRRFTDKSHQSIKRKLSYGMRNKLIDDEITNFGIMGIQSCAD